MSETTGMIAVPTSVEDPARARILAALMDGRAVTAKELACAAYVSPQTSNAYLDRLTSANLVSVEAQGRHRYYRLASPLTAQILESVMGAASSEPTKTPSWRGGETLRTARTCYDHLAGRLGVALSDSLIQAGHLTLSQDGGHVTERGHAFLRDFGANSSTGKRVFCRACLDWSERRPHIAGRLRPLAST